MAAKQSKNYTFIITLWLWDEHCPNDQLISRGLGCLEYTSEGYNLKRGSYTRASSMLKSFWHKLNFFLLRAAETRETSPVANETRLVLWPSCTYSFSKTLNMALHFRFYWIELLFDQDIILEIWHSSVSGKSNLAATGNLWIHLKGMILYSEEVYFCGLLYAAAILFHISVMASGY